MQTSLDPTLLHPETLTEVDRILRSCVHCGFCTSGCPTYQLLGDESDSPRGRIYLMKQAFEGDASFDAIAPHLDRCLTCRNCETNCPSGVDYSQLLDITKGLMFEQANGSLWRRLRYACVSGYFGSVGSCGLDLAWGVRCAACRVLKMSVGCHSHDRMH